MSYDPTAYNAILDALCVQIRTILWRNPSARLGIAYRPVSHAAGPAIATFHVGDELALTDGYVVAFDGWIPRDLDDYQRARWIDNVLRRLPILGRNCPIAA